MLPNEVSWLQYYWAGHLVLVLPSLLKLVVTGANTDKSEGESAVGEDSASPGLIHFRKKYVCSKFEI